MWCDWCNNLSYAVHTTFRITKEGHELKIETCGQCMHRTETEYIPEPVIRFRIEKEKRPAKKAS